MLNGFSREASGVHRDKPCSAGAPAASLS